MASVLKERQLTPDQEEEFEEYQAAPEKFEPDFDPVFEFKMNRKPAPTGGVGKYKVLSREEVAVLVAASKAAYEPPPVSTEQEYYPTYTREEVRRLMVEHDQYLEREKKWQQEKAKWDSRRMIASEPKTTNTIKRSRSTKT